jgi:CRP/FNR family cyclic AMP-dependent transcriptional regulator
MFKVSSISKSKTLLNQDFIDICRGYSVLRFVNKGTQIHDRGDCKPGLSIVARGQVKIGNYGVDGQYQLATVLQKGDTFGEFTLFADLPRTHNAQALTDCEIYHISETSFHKLSSEHPDILSFLLGSLAVKLHVTLERLDDVLRLPTHVQLAKLLYQACLFNNNNVIKMRQSDCAERLGVTVLSAHKAIKKLIALNLISTSYGAICIEDKGAMAEWLENNLSLLPIQDPTALT